MKKHQNDIVHRKNFLLSEIFNNQFRSWTQATLDVAVRWLLRQCGRIETESRRKCIELVCTFIPLLPSKTENIIKPNFNLFIKEIRSIRDYFESKVQTDGNVYFIERYENNSKNIFEKIFFR